MGRRVDGLALTVGGDGGILLYPIQQIGIPHQLHLRGVAAKLREPLVAEQLVETWRAAVERKLQPNLISIWLADGRSQKPEDN